MATIVVQPKYPNDPLPEVAADFAAAVGNAFPEDVVEIVTEPPHAHQVTFHEVLVVWIPAVGGAVQILQAAIAVGAWMKKRHREDKGVRPRTVTICESNGRIRRRITVASGVENAVEIETVTSDEFILPPRVH